MKYIKLILLVFSLLLLPWAGNEAWAKEAEITDLRWTARNDGDPPFVRIVTDLTKAVQAEAAIDKSGKNFEVILKNTQKSFSGSQYDMDPRAIDFATVSEKDGDTYIDVALTKPQKIDDIHVFALRPDAKLGKPHRLVIDIPIQGAKKSYTKPAASAENTTTKKPAAKKPSAEKEAPPQKVSVPADARKILKGKIICLDPGHGGTDVGAIGHKGNKEIYEKDVTLSIALPLRDMLTSAGAKVVMTRSTDKDVYGPWADDDPELQARCDVGNQANADVFVSIHIDSFSNGSVDGTTAYYYPKTAKDLMLAQMLHQSTMNLLSIPDRGVRSGHLYVNVNTNMPSVLMEMGYISNAHRVQMLMSSWGPKSIAKSLFKGLVDYFAAL